MMPTTNKVRTSSCSVGASSPSGSSTHSYRPSNCWCDSYCTANNDCCPLCTQPTCNKPSTDPGTPDSSAVQVASVADDTTSGLRARVAAEAAALAEEAGHPGDCTVHQRSQRARASIASVSSDATTQDYETTAEAVMQQVRLLHVLHAVLDCLLIHPLAASVWLQAISAWQQTVKVVPHP